MESKTQLNDNEKGHKQHIKVININIISSFFGRLCPKLDYF